MLEGLRHLFSDRPFVDILRDLGDIFLVAFLVYRAFVVLKGTRAMQMGIGFVVFGLLYLGAKYAPLATLQQLLSYVGGQLILIMVVVFQNDIRRALIRVGSRAWFERGHTQQTRVVDEVVAAATELARHRMGAIIAFEQDANVLEFVRSDGIQLDAVVTRELLVSLFVPESVNKTHDGAVLIRDLRIARGGVFFPMPETKITDATLGSRHRAAIGISEETDAVVVVVSEERGTISICHDGELITNLDGQTLRESLIKLFTKAEGAVDKLTAGIARRRKKPLVAPSSERPSARPAASSRLPRPKSGPHPAVPATPAPADARVSVEPATTARSSDAPERDASARPMAQRVSKPMPHAPLRTGDTPPPRAPQDSLDDDPPPSRAPPRAMTPSPIAASLLAAAESEASIPEDVPAVEAERSPARASSRPMPQAARAGSRSAPPPPTVAKDDVRSATPAVSALEPGGDQP